MSEQESRDRLNAALREAGFDVRGDVAIVRTTMSETKEVRRSEHAVVAEVCTEAWHPFAPRGLRLERFRKNPVVLWAHNYDGLPIARCLCERVRGEDSASRLVFKPQFHCDTKLSREVWALIKDAAGVEWDLGVIPAEWRDEGPVVTKWDVVEISAVPSEGCAEEIRCRIMKRTISSPAMLRSVEGAEPKCEAPAPPIDTVTSMQETKGPYRYVGEEYNEDPAWTVYGPGFQRAVVSEADAITYVAELNYAWRRGRESAAEGRAPTRPEAPEEDNVSARLSNVEVRVAAIADAIIRIDRRLYSTAERLQNPPVVRRWGDGPEEEEAGG